MGKHRLIPSDKLHHNIKRAAVLLRKHATAMQKRKAFYHAILKQTKEQAEAFDRQIEREVLELRQLARYFDHVARRMFKNEDSDKFPAL